MLLSTKMHPIIYLIILVVAFFAIVSCTNSFETNSLNQIGYTEICDAQLEKKKVSIYYDDLNRNKNTDLVLSNLAKMYKMQVADYSFDLSQNEILSLDEFINNEEYLKDLNSTKSIKIYLSGARKAINSDGWVSDVQLQTVTSLIQNLLSSSNDNMVVQLYLVGAGTGAVGLKYLVTLISEQKLMNELVCLEKALFTNPVLHTKYYNQNKTEISRILSYPKIMSRSGKVLEILASRNHNSDLKLMAYPKSRNKKWLEQTVFPGFHSQIIGGRVK